MEVWEIGWFRGREGTRLVRWRYGRLAGSDDVKGLGWSDGGMGDWLVLRIEELGNSCGGGGRSTVCILFTVVFTPSPPATPAVFGSYLSSHYSYLKLYRQFGLT